MIFFNSDFNSTSMNQSLVAARDTFSCFYIRCLVVVEICLCLLYVKFTANNRHLDGTKALQMMDVWMHD